MFIAVLTYIKPVEEVDKVLDAHRAYLDKYFTTGNFISCGRRVPRTGGIIMGKAANREEMMDILHEDPFYASGVVSYDVIEFAPTKWADGFEGFKNA